MNNDQLLTSVSYHRLLIVHYELCGKPRDTGRRTGTVDDYGVTTRNQPQVELYDIVYAPLWHDVR